MRGIDKDLDEILSLKDKEKLLKELKQGNLIDLFKGKYKPQYKPITKNKKTPLDQLISIGITEEEKSLLKKELLEIKKHGQGISISSYVRNKALSSIDLEEWSLGALKGIHTLSSQDYNKKHLEKKKREYVKLLNDVNEEDTESEVFYKKKLKEVEDKLKELKKVSHKRKYRLSGRVTFEEANDIRWKAARLNITIADYMRYIVFGYVPFDGNDDNLSIEARKRFYISVIDVQRNGWGEPPKITNCPNCQRYIEKIKILEKQLNRFSQFE